MRSEVRTSEAARLRAVLEDGRRGVRVLGISGPGGVGKSYLVRTVTDEMEAEGATWLKLSVDGSNEQVRGDLFALLEGQLTRSAPPRARTATPSAASPPAGSTGSPGRAPVAASPARRDLFPELRKVAAMHRELVEAVAAELESGAAPAEIKATALELLRMGRRLNKVVPKSKQFFDAVTTEDGTVGPTIDEAWRAVANLRALRVSSWVPTSVRDLLGAGHKERLRTDLWGLTSEALVTDLTQAVASARRPSTLTTTRVLLLIDDFEALAPLLEELLVGALIPRLAEAGFSSTVVIIGRDALAAMHPSWSQHCRPYLTEPIALAPLDRDASLALLADAGVPEERRLAMFEAAQGFPFLLTLLADEAREGGADAALFLRRFFDRTTRWLSDRQREWFTRIVYLDAVNVDTLAPLFPGEDLEAIQDWFEREASLRDPMAPVFRVRALVREKALRYLELRSPSRHREMLAQVAGHPTPDPPPPDAPAE